MPTFFQPGWLLLLWCGLAASIITLPIARTTRRTTPRPRAGHRLVRIALELVLFPIVYAVLLEGLGRADLAAGAALGTLHAALGVLAARLRGGEAPALDTVLRSFLARILYGLVFAFLYVVPPP